MKKRKKVFLGVLVGVVLIAGFVALRIPSWTQTYGLSEDVISGARNPTAEETIRLSFYDGNRYKNLPWPERIKDWLFKDVKIIGIKELQSNDVENPSLEQSFDVMTSEDYFCAPEDRVMWDRIYRLTRADEDSSWQIYSIEK